MPQHHTTTSAAVEKSIPSRVIRMTMLQPSRNLREQKRKSYEIAIAVGACAVALLAAYVFRATRPFEQTLAAAMLALLLYMPLHEALHALGFSAAGVSRECIRVKLLGTYVDADVEKRAWLIATALPALVIVILSAALSLKLPPVLVWLVGTPVLLSGSAGDFIDIVRVLLEPGDLVRDNEHELRVIHSGPSYHHTRERRD